MSKHPSHRTTPSLCNSLGEEVMFLDIDPSMIHIADIAQSLAKECRFVGHCRGFYSVAQHSVLCSLHVAEGYEQEALLHDSDEWITGDMPSPFKRLLRPRVTEIQRRITHSIFKKFGVVPYSSDDPISPAVHEIDGLMYAVEYHDIMPKASLAWHDPGVRPPLSVIPKIEPMEWEQAYEYFLDRFAELWIDQPELMTA